MTLQVVLPLAIRFPDGDVVRFEPHAVFTVTTAQGNRLLEQAPSRLRLIVLPESSEYPLQPGGPTR